MTEIRRLLSGNQAVARGAYESGVKVAASYPGTPSTEILEEISRYPGIYAEWSPNEKIAVEVAMGASIGGVRSLASMKHVGVNVASDTLFTFSYTGVNAGFVLISCDDPGMHSSQNEQDNRLYARFMQIPMLEPSSSQEAKDFVALAYEMSENHDTPVMVRLTTRISHSKGVVILGEKKEIKKKDFSHNREKYVMIPANARKRHPLVLERMGKIKTSADSMNINKAEYNDVNFGIIASGVSYQYAREVMPEASFLKLGLSYPLPEKLIREFASRVKNICVVEELEPFLEEEIKIMGIKVIGKEFFPRVGEFTPDIVSEGLYRILSSINYLSSKNLFPSKVYSIPSSDGQQEVNVLPRPPVLCPGCSHRGFMYVAKKLKLIVMGDIGCYTLGVLSPLEAMDTCICMGASISSALGMMRAMEAKDRKKIIAVIGDSTFVHSGIPGLIDAVYNNTPLTCVILDNRTTAMTGGQHHPGTGITLRDEESSPLDFVKLSRAIGIDRVRVIPPYDIDLIEKVLKEEIEAQEPSVIIIKGLCPLIDKSIKRIPVLVEEDECNGCGLCFGISCPSIISYPARITLSSGKVKRVNKARIDTVSCTGCGVCIEVCTRKAIKKI